MRSKGLLFALPWIVGLSVFTLYPFAASVYYSFTEFSVLRAPHWTGLENFSAMVHDDLFWKVLRNTLLFGLLSVVGGLFISLGLALLMNAVRRGQALYSVVFYLPHLIPAVVASLLWNWMFNGQCGLINGMLAPFFSLANALRGAIDPGYVTEVLKQPDLAWGPPAWLTSWPLSSLFLVVMWGIGQTAFIYLAKLQDVPQELYEAAEIDGANVFQKIRHITLPMISPVILFNVIMGIIGALQIFTEPYLIFPEGGPDRAAYFLPQYIYDNAFRYMRMGYACALSWILFVIILLLTALAFRLSRDRVYYAGR